MRRLPSIFLTLTCLMPVLANAMKTQLVQNLKAGKPQAVVCYDASLTHKGQWVKDLYAALQPRFPGQATAQGYTANVTPIILEGIGLPAITTP
ncbi:hypothetical protein [Cerasicoccus frondis]|uniref:hypothetical protein n=1 Tax=Cerasicoccus frondis TaxID=490090 RepID=UPI002852B0FE|nr:hypothetical protein [Cerasicoccus frondis]